MLSGVINVKAQVVSYISVCKDTYIISNSMHFPLKNYNLLQNIPIICYFVTRRA